MWDGSTRDVIESLVLWGFFNVLPLLGAFVALALSLLALKTGKVRINAAFVFAFLGVGMVLASGCGTDGMAYPAVCGAPDGRIAIIDVPESQLEAARKLGFSLLSERPRAQRMAC
jgi:hypothetical protein